MDAIKAGFEHFGEWVGRVLPDSVLKGLLVNGVLAGVSTVLVFLPQIMILFFFILVLEESGYLPRAAFLLDRIMGSVGLSGRAFIPLLSSFACAIPGIMATRTIQNPRDRLATIMIAPLMTCSARLPVYALIIGAFIPQRAVWGGLQLQGLVLFALYIAGVASAMGVAYVLKRSGSASAFQSLLLELPAYHWPNLRSLAIGLWQRVENFPEPGGYHHPGVDGGAVGVEFLSGAARRCRGPGNSIQHRGSRRRVAGGDLRPDRIQLADLPGARSGLGGARGGGRRARNGIRPCRRPAAATWRMR